MNAVLAYAIEHQANARWLLLSRGMPLDDVEDVVQDALIKVLLAEPPHANNPKGYWMLTVISASHSYWRRRREAVVLDFDKADSRQNPETAACQRETIREAWNAAAPYQRRAIVEILAQNGRPLSPNTRKRALNALRNRLREGAAI